MLKYLESLSILIKSITILDFIKKKYLKLENLKNLVFLVELSFKISNYLEKKKQIEIYEIMINVLVNYICCIRNLIPMQESVLKLIDTNCPRLMFEIMKQNVSTKEVIANSLRILAKLSISSTFSDYLMEYPELIKTLLEILEVYKENNFFSMRLAFILANLTTYDESASSLIYFELKGFKIIFDTFAYYISKTTNEDDYFETMLKSFSNFDFLEQGDKDVLNKIIRLLANIFTEESSSLDFISNNYSNYKLLLRKLRFFMNENEVSNNSELLICVLSCISNILYWDKPSLVQKDFELETLKQDLVSAVSFIILQPKNEEILIEGLRVISNLSRTKQGVGQIVNIKFYDAINILINHRSRDVVYYSIGILINISQDQTFKKSPVCIEIFYGLIDLLDECCIDDVDILNCAMKALTNIISDNLKNDNDTMVKYFKRLDELLSRFGKECDIILSSDEIEAEEVEEISQLRNIINAVVNSIPDEEFDCPYTLCKRKFKSKDHLDDHITRRHLKG